MKIILKEHNIIDFEFGSKALKKAAKKGEIDQFDAAYLAAAIISSIVSESELSPNSLEKLDQAVGALLALSAESDSPPG